MKPRLPFSALLALALTAGLRLGAAGPAAVKPGYHVVVEVTFNEEGLVEAEHVVESDDFSGSQVLNQLALKLAAQIKQPPRVKDGKKVKFKGRAPFDFPVEGDEGAAANLAPKPVLKSAAQPVYPADLGSKGVVGGAVAELIIRSDGQVGSVKILRASHPEFAQAVQDAVQRWVFIPAIKDGNPVESRWRVVIGFATDTKEPDLEWQVAPRPSLGGYTVVHSKVAAQFALHGETPAGTPPTPAPSK